MGDTPKYAKNKTSLARIIGVSRVTIDLWIKLPEAPKTMSNGRYIVADWIAFKEGRKVDSGTNESAEEMAQLRLQKLRNEVAQSELDLMKSSDEVMPIEFVTRLLAHLIIGFRRVIESAPISAEAREFMYSGVEKIDCDKFLGEMFEEVGRRRPPGAINGEADEG